MNALVIGHYQQAHMHWARCSVLARAATTGSAAAASIALRPALLQPAPLSPRSPLPALVHANRCQRLDGLRGLALLGGGRTQPGR